MKRSQVKTILMASLAVSSALAADDRFTIELEDAARVASVMVDGDACRKIVTARAMDYLLRTDPNDRFLASDNYEVNMRLRRREGTLIRISRLVCFPLMATCGCQFRPTDKIRVVISSNDSAVLAVGSPLSKHDSGNEDRAGNWAAHHGGAETRLGLGAGAGVG